VVHSKSHSLKDDARENENSHGHDGDDEEDDAPDFAAILADIGHTPAQPSIEIAEVDESLRAYANELAIDAAIED